MSKAAELITDAIENLIPADAKYFDYTMGLLDMALELAAITPEERAALASRASTALYNKMRENK